MAEPAELGALAILVPISVLIVVAMGVAIYGGDVGRAVALIRMFSVPIVVVAILLATVVAVYERV